MNALLKSCIFVMLLLITTRMEAQLFCDNFGEGGLAFSRQANDSRFNVIRQLSNGRLLAAGGYLPFGGNDGLMVKLLADGSPDPAFGEYRGVSVPDMYGPGDDEILDFEPLSNGKILAGGQQAGNAMLVLLSAAGKLDNTFASAGRLTLTGAIFKDLHVNGSTAYVLKTNASGTLSFSAYNTASGALVTSFGVGGSAVLPVMDAFADRPARVLRQTDGKWVIAMSSPNPDLNLDFIRLVRLQSNGRPDSTFGVNGLKEEPEISPAVAASLAIDTNGNIYLGGTYSSPKFLTCKKWQPNGALANDFGPNASPIHGPAGLDVVLGDIMVDADNNVYFAGTRPDLNGHPVVIIGRWDADGLDFNAFGIHTWTFPGATATEGRSMLRLSDGSFIVVGQATLDNGQTRGVASRFQPNGSLDASFSTQGSYLCQVLNSSPAEDVRVLPDGRILVGGTQGTPVGVKYALAQYLPDGTPDPDFGEEGYVVGAFEARIKTLHLFSDGRILAGAYTNAPDPGDLPGVTGASQVVLRLHPDGRLDSTFGVNGKVVRHWGNSAFDNTFSNMRVDLNDNILLAGSSRFNATSYTDIAVYRMLPDGSPDGSFGNNGLVVVSAATLSDFNKDIAVDSLGRVLVSGNSNAVPHVRGFLFRLLPDGSIDSSFAQNGFFYYERPEGDNRLEGLLALRNGKIAVINTAEFGAQTYVDTIRVFRLLDDGTLDASFGEGGLARVLIPNSQSVRNLGFREDEAGNLFFSGEIIVSGANTSYVASLKPDGSMNEAFAPGGFVLTSAFAPKGDLAIGPNGGVYVSFNIGLLGGLNLACVGNAVTNAIDPWGQGSKTLSLVLYPNPTTGDLTIDLGAPASAVTVILRNLPGQEVARLSTQYERLIHLEIPAQPGVYLVEIIADGKIGRWKVLKE
ncbi:MAG: T9SS type A sorting domain-containing protein [Bacteroidia bacterium]